ncbi:MAG: DUF2783 domain-containing protein [Roseobacter sp.]
MALPDNLGTDADTFYAQLIQAHEGLSEAESHALNARLVLILANEVGDLERLTVLLKEARKYASS